MHRHLHLRAGVNMKHIPLFGGESGWKKGLGHSWAWSMNWYGVPSVCLGCLSKHQVCYCGPSRWEIVIDCCSSSVQRTNVGSATLLVYVGSLNTGLLYMPLLQCCRYWGCSKHPQCVSLLCWSKPCQWWYLASDLWWKSLDCRANSVRRGYGCCGCAACRARRELHRENLPHRHRSESIAAAVRTFTLLHVLSLRQLQ